MSAEPPLSGTADVGGGGRSVTVLVVDDNEVALRLCRRVLEKAGYKVLTASDGLEAVSVALANSPDVILMDVAMPGIDGLEATRRIKQQRPGIAIVIASVLATASNRERFLASGADDVMMTPLRLSDMIAAVARLTPNRGPQMKDLTGTKLGSYELEGRVARTEQPTRRASPVQALREMVRMFIKYVTLKRAHDQLGENARRQLRELNRIGIALSAERDIIKLQEFILTTLRRLTNADGASLWRKTLGEDGSPQLFLASSQNSSIGNTYQAFTVPVDEKTVVGYTVTVGWSQIYDDAYNPPPGKPQGGRNFDQQFGYRTKSMLTVPMRNYDNEVVGAVQLINAKRSFETKLTAENVPDEVVSFRLEDLEMIESIASQAAIAIDNKNLLDSIESLFDGFVRMSLSALELRDPSAASRSYRVEALTTGLARAVSGIEVGKYRHVRLTEDQFKELRYACLLHDLGVIGVREHILIKAKKLLPGQLEVIQARFAAIEASVEVKFATEKLDVMRSGKGRSQRLEDVDRRLAQEIDQLHRWTAAIVQANEPSVLPEETASILEQLSKQTYQDLSGTSHPMLEPQEFGTLSISKGVLDPQERLEMESHVTHSFELVKTIPWPPSMRSVPEIVFAHHEKLDGSGYPRGLAGDQISLQARMLTIADIYDALTAQDRPYKRAVSTAVALEILRAEANEGKLDKDLLDVFVSKEVFLAASGQRSAAAESSGTADVGGGGRSVTVLVADDNDVALRLCRRVLEKAGYKVLTASDGVEAVSLALANSPDMILLDDAMPGLNSPWATRQIRKQRPGIAIVIASVDPGASNRKRYLAAGADDMLIKPFRLDDLLAVVAKLTANRGPVPAPAKVGATLAPGMAHEVDLRDGSKVLEQKILETAIRVTMATAGLLTRTTAKGNQAVIVSRGFPAEVDAMEFHRGQGIIGAVMESLRATAVADVSASFDLGSPPDLAAYGLQAGICAPMLEDGRLWGTISVFDVKKREWTGDDQRVLATLGNQGVVAVRNAELYDNNQRSIWELRNLQEALQAATSTLDLNRVLQQVLAGAAKASSAQIGCIALEESGKLILKGGFGTDSTTAEKLALGVGGDICRDVMASAKPFMEAMEQGATNDSPLNPRAVLCVPITLRGKPFGVLFLANYQVGHAFTPDHRNLVTELAAMAAVAIDNARLFKDREEAILASLEQLGNAIDARDPWTGAHSERVALYALMIARQMKYSPKDQGAWVRLERGGRLHDLGVIGVPDAILQKTDRLTDEEFTKMKAHAVIGFDILSPMRSLTDELLVVRSHHERYDGKGYPDRKKGDELPIFVWIVSAADAIDAMTSDRRHQQAMSFEAAVEQVRAGAGTQFHPDVADAVLDAANNGTLKLIPH